MANANPLRAVTQLQEAVHSLAPVLRPQILPKGAAYGLDLVLGLCKTAEQKLELRALIQDAKPASNGNSEDDELEAQVVGAFDAEKKAFNIEKVVWMKQQDAVVHEFARFLELQLDDPEEAKQIVAHFLEANGHAADNILAAEQCFNAAFALQAILRAFPRPPFAIDGVPVEIDEDTSVAKAFAPLFGAKKAAQKTEKKSSKSRSKKRKST
ncbi:hypothetical protein Gpo141_00001304 [Globisporangium polare]